MNRKYAEEFYKNRKPRKDSKTGVLGITLIEQYNGVKYRYELQHEKKRYIGHYRETIAEAIDDRDEKIVELFKSKQSRLKAEQDEINLREKYDEKRVNGIALPLFKGKEPRKDSTTGYRGVERYKPKGSEEIKYRAWITVKGQRYYKSGFITPSEAYYIGRKFLEEKYLPDIPRKD